MEITQEQIFTFKINWILIETIKKGLQISIETKIKKDSNCKCSLNNFDECKCVSIYFENNINSPKIKNEDKRNMLNKIRTRIEEKLVKNEQKNNHHQTYPNSLEIFDLTGLYTIAKNLLKLFVNTNINKKDFENIFDIKDKHLSYPRSIELIQYLRSNYYAHLNEYKTRIENYNKFIDLFKRIINNLNLNEDVIKKLNDEIDSIDKTTLLNSINDDLMRKRFTKEILKSDNIFYPDETNYILRNENEIIDKLLDKTNHKNKLILTQIGGSGKTTMVRYISKRLKNNHDFIIKWFQPFHYDDSNIRNHETSSLINQNESIKLDFIEIKYKNILKDEFGCDIEKLKDNNEQILKYFNNYLTNLLKLNDNLNVLFIFDNVKNEQQISKYLNSLPQRVKVLITTRKNDLFQKLNESYIFQIKLINKIDSFNYFKNVNKHLDEQTVNDLIDVLVQNDQITTLKLKLALSFIENNKEKSINEIKQQIESKTNDEEFIYMILNSFSNDQKINLFLNYITLIDNNLVLYDTLKLLLNQHFDDESDIDEKINILIENGVIDELRDDDGDYGIKIHDTINRITHLKLINEQNKQFRNNLIEDVCKTFNDNVGEINKIKNDDWDLINKNYKHLLLICNDQFYDKYCKEYCEIIEKTAYYSNYSIFDFAICINLLEKNLTIYSKFNENQSNNQHIANVLNKIALVYKSVDDFEKSLDYLKKSFNIITKTVPEKDQINLDLAILLNNIGSIHFNTGEYNEALGFYMKSLNILEKLYRTESDHPRFAHQFNNIGLVYNELGDYETALDYLLSSLDIYENANKYQQNHYDIALSLQNIGLVYDNMKKYDKSLEYHQKSFEMRKIVYKNQPNHVDLASSLNNIGLAYFNCKKYEISLKYFNQSLDIYKIIYSNYPNHQDLARSYNNFASVYNNIGDFEKALDFYNKSLEIYKNVFVDQPNHPRIALTINNIAILYKDKNDYEKSLNFLNQSLNMYRIAYENQPNHPDIAMVLENIGDLYNDMNDHENSLDYFYQTLDIYRDVCINKPNNPDIACLLMKIGECFLKMNKYDVSLGYFNQSLDIYKIIHENDTNHPDLAKQLSNIGTVYYELNDYEKSLDFYNQSLIIYRNVYLDQPHHSNIEILLDNIDKVKNDIDKNNV